MRPSVPESKIEFWGEGKTGVPGEKPLEARERTNNIPSPHMAPDRWDLNPRRIGGRLVLLPQWANESNNGFIEKTNKQTKKKQKQTRVDGALGTVFAYRVIFENGEPARKGVFGQQNCTC